MKLIRIILLAYSFSLFSQLLAIEFPKEHTFHKDFALEWCYFIGNLNTKDGKELGYELSFFKAKLNGKEEIPHRQ